MLPLNSRRWGELQHCYGRAANIPQMLQALRTSPTPSKRHDEEPWYSIWSSLCHQDDVYSASYAAVPHIIDIAKTAPWPIDFSFFIFPVSVEICRLKGRGPPIPDDLADDYRRAISQLGSVAALKSSSPLDRTMIQAIASALAVSHGDMELAEALMELDRDYIAKILANED